MTLGPFASTEAATVTHILTELARPRAVGSEGEQWVAEQIRQRLRKCGWQVRDQCFCASYLPLSLMPRLVGGVLAGLMPAAGLLYAGSTGTSALITAAALLAVVAARGWGWRLVERMLAWGPQFQTCNLVATLDAHGSAPESPPLVLMAHYDSKSQSLPILLRGAILVVGLVAMVLMLLLSVTALAADTIVWPRAVLTIAAVAAAAFLTQTLGRNGNSSPGALDNASGVAVLLALAGRLKDSTAGRGITLVFTGAEEVGLAGALRFIQTYERRSTSGPLAAQPLRVINVDSVGTSCTICLAGKDKNLRKQIAAAADAVGLRARPFRWGIAVGLDHMPIARRGHAAVSIVGKLRLGDLLAIHSARDRPERIAPETLAKLLELLQVLAESLAHE